MKTHILVILFFLSLACYPSFSTAQVSSGGNPYTLSSAFIHQTKSRKKAVNSIRVKDVDMDIIERELEELNKCKDCNNGAYYGKEVEVGINFFKSAQVFETNDGRDVWLLNIESEEAKGYQLIFSQFELPEDAKLFIYNEDRSMVLGSFTSENNRNNGAFLTQYINGSNICIEYSAPKDAEDCRIYIDKVVYIFSDIFNPSRGPFSEDGSATCQINTTCELGNDDVKIRSTVLILEKSQENYWGMCTGVLLTIGGSWPFVSPILLTSNHCMESESGEISDPENWIFLFRHESIWCSGSGYEVPKDNVRSALGAKVLSRDIGSKKTDYLLLELNNSVDQIALFDVGIAGWSSDDLDATSSGHLIGIHHPRGDVKKISTSYTKPITVAWNKNKEKNHWAVKWGKGGRTEPGSSGSPLFNTKNQVVGFLHGGVHEEICNYSHLDYYGKMSDAYKDGQLAKYLGLYSRDPIPKLYSTVSSLDVKIGSIPKTPSEKNNIYLTASANNGMTKIHWTWLINKESGDYEEYPAGHPKVMVIKETTSNFERTSKVGPYKLDIGTYLVRLFANNENGLSEIKSYILTVSPSIDPCIYGGIYMEGQKPTVPHKSIYRELGSEEEPKRYTTYANVMYQLSTPYNSISLAMDVCHNRYDIGWRRWYPKYDGIRNISTYLHYFDENGVKKTKHISDQSFSYGEALSHLGSFCSFGYNQVYFEHVGKNTIETRVIGGYHNYENLSPKGKLQSLTPINSKDKYDAKYLTEVFVVDCGSEVTVESPKSPLVSTKYSDIKRISAAVISVDSVVFEKGEEYDVKAFYRINLKPGIHIKEGATFYASIEACPSIEARLRSQEYSIIDNESLDENVKEKDIILAYPNPTTGIVNIKRSNNETEVYGAEVYSLDGRMIKNKGSIPNPYSFDISNQANGLYIVKVFTNQGVSSHKVILSK